MATSEEQKEQIRALVSVGDLSNVEIGKQIGVSEKTVRNLIKKEGLVKSEIKKLVEREITNTIIGNEIKSEKSELSPKQKEAYNEVYLTMAQGLNLFNNSTLENQELVNMAQDELREQIGDDRALAVAHLPNLMAISKTTEGNRKQLFGATETYKQKDDNSIESKDNTKELTLEEAEKQALELGVPLSMLTDQ